MKPRMNKEELLFLLETLKIDVEEFWVLSSGALVLRDIYPDAGDLDIAVTVKGLEQLKRIFNLKQKENGWYIVSDKIECACFSINEEFKPEKFGKYYLQNINEYYNYLLNSEREKDKARISLVKKYVDTINRK